jgi:ATP-dependent RNA helicase RhlE
MPFRKLGLSQAVLKGVEAMGYHEPTPIQEEAIPQVLDGRDVVGAAQTGTGKTAAFVLPMLDRISAGNKRPRALIVTPTRELAQQILDVSREPSKETGHHVASIYGGVGYKGQLDALRNGVDLLVATPGRLLDLADRGEVDFRDIEVFVLDEADRMLDMGFWPDVRKILNKLPAKRQNLLFSATMSKDVLRVVGSLLTDPVSIEVGPKSLPVEAIDQAIYPVAVTQKADLLAGLVSQNHWDRVLVFTRTKERADRLTRSLKKKGVAAEVIHSDKAQAKRQQALEGFRSGKHEVLIATDVMARGIDVDDISHVINYDVPENPEDYVHRIGRTARAGREGTAVSFITASDLHILQEIESHLGRVLRSEDLEGFDYAKRALPNPGRTAEKSTRRVFSSGVLARGKQPGDRSRRW